MKDYPVPTGSGIVEINSIEIYNASNLLITSNKGVFLFNPKSGIYTEFKKLNEKSFFQKSVIRFLKRDKNNRYWAGVVGKGLFCFDKDWNILFSYTERYQFNGEVFDLKMPVCVAFDNAGNTWVGTDGNGLVKINPSLKKFSGIIPSDLIRSGITGDFILSVYKDENGNIYSGVLNSGLLIYNQRSGVKRIVSTRSDKFLTSDNITFIQPWHGDKLLLGTWVGLAVFDIRNGKIEKMNNVLEKKKIPVSCIYKVDEDFFLIGTTFGLYSLSGNIIKPKLFNRVSIFINNRRGKYF